MKLLRCSLILAAIVGFAAESAAAVITWETTLTATQEVPPNGSSATGSGTVTFDTLTNILGVDLTWSGLTGDGIQAHIHCCVDPSGTVGIALDLWLAGSPRPASGSFSAFHDLDLTNPFRAAFVAANGGTSLSAFAALQAAMNAPGHAYFNIHTANYPGGEIRGNLAPAQVPEPATLVLVGLAAVMMGRRRLAMR